MNLLKHGDTIGIISPSSVANPNNCEVYAKGIEKLGFRVKFGKNIYKDTYKFTASVAERVDDLNEMIYDEDVKLVFFGGGWGSVDLLPYIDYNRIKETPKLFLSYSDGTSILNAIYANTGITTYYGQTPGLFDHINEYDRKQFVSHLKDGAVTAYILFIEDLDKFQSVRNVSIFLTCIGQSRLMEQVTGLLFGHYSDEISPLLFEVLERFGKKYGIPVAYCDDFGHGANHAIFPIGRKAILDTKNKTLLFQ